MHGRSGVRLQYEWVKERIATNLVVSDDIEESDDIRATRKVLKDLDFSLDLLLLDRLKDFDNAFLVVDDIDPLENLRIFSPAYLYGIRLTTGWTGPETNRNVPIFRTTS